MVSVLSGLSVAGVDTIVDSVANLAPVVTVSAATAVFDTPFNVSTVSIVAPSGQNILEVTYEDDGSTAIPEVSGYSPDAEYDYGELGAE